MAAQTALSTRTRMSRVQMKCYKCKKLGHSKNKCPLLSTLRSENKNTSDKMAFTVAFLDGNQFNKDNWYVDSGASVHLTSK